MIHLPPDFKEFLRLLNVHKVEYLLVGGYAVGYHGYPRATADMDVWVAVHPANAERLVAALKEFGFDVPDLSVDLFLKEGQIVRMGVPPIRIEIMTTISGVEFAQCYISRLVAMVDDVDVSLIGLDHLRVNKKAAGRYKDLNDLDNLP
jgi:hypothetical protein